MDEQLDRWEIQTPVDSFNQEPLTNLEADDVEKFLKNVNSNLTDKPLSNKRGGKRGSNVTGTKGKSARKLLIEDSDDE